MISKKYFIATENTLKRNLRNAHPNVIYLVPVTLIYLIRIFTSMSMKDAEQIFEECIFQNKWYGTQISDLSVSDGWWSNKLTIHLDKRNGTRYVDRLSQQLFYLKFMNLTDKKIITAYQMKFITSAISFHRKTKFKMDLFYSSHFPQIWSSEM